MCQKISIMLCGKRRLRNSNLCPWQRRLLGYTACLILTFTLIIHSVVSQQVNHDDNIAQESSDTSVRVPAPRMFDQTDDQYSYSSGTDLMADESVDNTER